MAYSERAIRMIPVVIGTLLLSLTTPNFSDLPSFEVKNPLERSNAIFKLQRIEEEDLKIEQAKKTLSFLNFDDLAFYRMTFLGQDIIYSNYHFWVFYCYLGLGLLSIVLLHYITEGWRWEISQYFGGKNLSEKPLFYQVTEGVAEGKESLLYHILEIAAEDKEATEFIIKIMEEIFNYKLNPEQKALVIQSIHKAAENNQPITMLDCFQEWNKYPVLDYWNAYVQKYLLL